LAFVEATTKRKHKRYSPAEREQLLAAWHESGESAAKFCARHGVNESNLWRWAKAPAPCAAAARVAPAGFVELRATRASGESGQRERDVAQFEVECRPGLCIRVFHGADVDVLSRLIDAIGGHRPC
jgi:hypothetical protein